ncbi:hypothetical protein AN639_02565 [Candidatus Epulonipiscium fishelsonii]|uniref:Uncharacterized protein n=1 Tax=Candidatus Epulonipiscium fishelsonii TaxID=77094 RepID=A0ACC8XA64_9FIRM|nr:hypothetical protein AN396_09450 [Epulopiscium sp. SCG-B11WGA-EpuloA1]ONI42009.1 hypothetical protein AN639_02565 [Epulopiscium sp. SCG-B05WGA-EpuloA1]ONI46835.1 hypothetical protein AN644_02460 [Epulopiscium sp. SCG-C06WGA-EpuloA1]
MKNTNICPKCQDKDILMIPGTIDVYRTGNNIHVGWFCSPILVNRYVCCNCGYSEEWIDKEDIPKLKKKYE